MALAVDVGAGVIVPRDAIVQDPLGAKVVKVGGDKVRQAVTLRCGIDAETGKRIQQAIKGSKLKLQAAIQGDAVRVSGAKRDELQAAMALLRKEVAEWPLSFDNFRD